MPSNNAQNIITSLQGQIDQISVYGQDQSGVDLPVSITKSNIYQNSSGQWTETEVVEENPYQSSTNIRLSIDSEREATISNYEGLAIPYDNQITSITAQINSKKAEIVSLVTSAIGIACSVGIASTASSNPITVSGTVIAIGRTVYQDTATVSLYDYQSNYTSNSPYNTSSADISSVGAATSIFVTTAAVFGNLSTGSTSITGIITGSINVGNRIDGINGLISAGSSVHSIGADTIFMTKVSLGTTSLQIIKFGYDTTSLTSYSGKGYLTNVADNIGSVVGLYATVTGISTLGIAVPACVAIASSITAIAAEIATLRSQRSSPLTPVNQVKDLKKGAELQVWSAKRSATTIQNTPASLNQTISSLNSF